MDELEAELHQLVGVTCSYPPGSLERQRGLNRLIRLIQQTQKLWRDYGPDYEDALQQTWIYFCRNLCEATTADPYDPSRASLTTWMNAYLRRRLQDFYERRKQEQITTASPRSGPDEERQHPIDHYPSPSAPPPILEEVLDWVEREARHLRRIHLRDRPEVNCQVLISRRLPPETPWNKLAAEFNVPIATLSNFYQRECLPRLLSFGKEYGFL